MKVVWLQGPARADLGVTGAVQRMGETTGYVMPDWPESSRTAHRDRDRNRRFAVQQFDQTSHRKLYTPRFSSQAGAQDRSCPLPCILAAVLGRSNHVPLTEHVEIPVAFSPHTSEPRQRILSPPPSRRQLSTATTAIHPFRYERVRPRPVGSDARACCL